MGQNMHAAGSLGVMWLTLILDISFIVYMLYMICGRYMSTGVLLGPSVGCLEKSWSDTKNGKTLFAFPGLMDYELSEGSMMRH